MQLAAARWVECASVVEGVQVDKRKRASGMFLTILPLGVLCRGE